MTNGERLLQMGIRPGSRIKLLFTQKEVTGGEGAFVKVEYTCLKIYKHFGLFQTRNGVRHCFDPYDLLQRMA